MHALCHEFDWSKTVLGPASGWSQSLRTAAALILASPFPNILLWGQQLIQVYNDAYQQIMGSKHPLGLGQPTQACWPEVWHINEPMYQAVWTGKSLSLANRLFAINRSGSMQDAWFTLAYSPVLDDNGQIGGILVTVFETTDQVIEKERREQALADLDQSEQRFALLVGATSEIVYTMSADWRHMEQLIGKDYLKSTMKLNGRWMEEYIPEAERQRVWTIIDEAIKEKITFEAEHQVFLNDGSIGWVFSRAIPILDKAGNICQWIGAASDITERKASDRRLRIATEAAQMATWEWDLARNQVFWNEQHFRLFGLEPQNGAVSPELFFEHVHPLDRDRIGQELRLAMANDVEYNLEFRALRQDSSERWMNGYGRVMEKAAGKPVTMSGVMFDITARRQIEKQLHQIQERQTAILESATDYAILTLDMELRVKDWNAGAERMLGYSEGEILGQSGEILFVPEDRAEGAAEHERKMAVHHGRAVNEHWHLRKDGSRFYGSGITSPLLDEAGNVMGLLKVMRDLTIQRQAEDATKEADKRKDQFLAMLAHELRNPISTVQNAISILKITHAADSGASQVVGIMDKQTSHLVRMIDDLLDVSRVTQGKIELKLQRLDIGLLIESIVQAIQPQFDARKKQLHISALANDLFVEGDATRLSQVVTNLLTNSLRYTGDDGQAWVDLASENGQALITVKDNGIGLSTEQQTSVFELFVQGDNSLARSQGGLGIGLTLVRQLVGMHGGQVQAKSPGMGQGSEFRVHLPLHALSVKQLAADEARVDAKQSALHLLLIDDMQELATMTAMLLKLRGYQVDVRLSGRAGIEAIESLKPAVVLCDIGMPELNGYQTAQLIRQQEWGKKVILIALSGYGQEEDKQQAKQAGFDAHLTKPVNMQELEDLIQSIKPTRLSS